MAGEAQLIAGVQVSDSSCAQLKHTQQSKGGGNSINTRGILTIVVFGLWKYWIEVLFKAHV